MNHSIFAVGGDLRLSKASTDGLSVTCLVFMIHVALRASTKLTKLFFQKLYLVFTVSDAAKLGHAEERQCWPS